jgi:hypothetical protein
MVTMKAHAHPGGLAVKEDPEGEDEAGNGHEEGDPALPGLGPVVQQEELQRVHDPTHQTQEEHHRADELQSEAGGVLGGS